MFGLSKILPLLVMAGAAKQGLEHYKPLLDYTTRVATQAELNQITKMILLDYTVDETLPTGENFSKYVRERMQVQNDSRDPANDQWGTPYVYIFKDNKAYVISAGTDTKFNTDDDLYSKVNI